ncbi:hypothetical protein GCM10022244_01250 [Streptomyces gulbargensis]|uniref:Uncharacterized protein n=1 Tax=Streptomyces gulbargensis TaxID=364901 RepID=A0ABP7L6T8_9ACTN
MAMPLVRFVPPGCWAWSWGWVGEEKDNVITLVSGVGANDSSYGPSCPEALGQRLAGSPAVPPVSSPVRGVRGTALRVPRGHRKRRMGRTAASWARWKTDRFFQRAARIRSQA